MREALLLVDPMLLSRILWLIVAIFAVLILRRALREPYDLEITHATLQAGNPPDDWQTSRSDAMQDDRPEESPEREKAGQPAALRIALLTDLHAEYLRVSPARLNAALAAEDYDVLLFGGDMTGRHHRPKRAQKWLDAIQSVAAKKQTPCFAVVGNHDSPASLDLLRKAGFKVIRNESVVLTGRDGWDWLLVGLDILKVGQPDFEKALHTAGPHGLAVPPQRRIVLAHNPDTIFKVPAAAAGFFLAGHFHGGQIFMPFHLEFFLLRREKVGRMGHHKGAFVLNGLSCYISRGLGSVLFPLRLNSRPELPFLLLSVPPETN